MNQIVSFEYLIAGINESMDRKEGKRKGKRGEG